MSGQGGRGRGQMHYAGGRLGKAAGVRRGKAADRLQAADGLAVRRQGRGKASGGHKISLLKLVTIWISLLKEHISSATAADLSSKSSTYQMRMAGKIRGVLQRLKSMLGTGLGSRAHLNQRHAPPAYDAALTACKPGVTAQCIAACRVILQQHEYQLHRVK